MPRPYFQNSNKVLQQILRVSHAGEYGAVQIYRGQLAATKSRSDKEMLTHMLAHEQEHLDFFKQALPKYSVRPSFLLPIWHVAGYALGVVTALGGVKTAMLCTQVIEEVINEHYTEQKQSLEAIQEKEIAVKIEQFRLEEEAHHDIAIQNGSLDAPLYNIISPILRLGCLGAIFLSKII